MRERERERDISGDPCVRERMCLSVCERERERERYFFVSILRDFAVKMSHLLLASCQDVPSLVRRSLCV